MLSNEIKNVCAEELTKVVNLLGYGLHDEKDLQELVDILAQRKNILTELNLGCNNIGDDQAKILINARVKCLRLPMNEITNLGAIELAKNNKYIDILDLSDNMINNEGLEKLKEYIANKKIDLSKNKAIKYDILNNFHQLVNQAFLNRTSINNNRFFDSGKNVEHLAQQPVTQNNTEDTNTYANNINDIKQPQAMSVVILDRTVFESLIKFHVLQLGELIKNAPRDQRIDYITKINKQFESWKREILSEQTLDLDQWQEEIQNFYLQNLRMKSE